MTGWIDGFIGSYQYLQLHGGQISMAAGRPIQMLPKIAKKVAFFLKCVLYPSTANMSAYVTVAND